LGVTPRSTRKEISEACEDALLDADGVDDERRLNLARQALSTPNERIAAELGYLLELRPAEARKAMKATSHAKWMEVADTASGLARVNALAEAARRAASQTEAQEATRQLVSAWGDIDDAAVTLQINEVRALSEFGTVTRADVRRNLSVLMEQHTDHAVAALESNGDLPLVLTRLLTEDLIPNGLVGGKFTTALISSYAKKTNGVLASAAERSLASLLAFKDSGSDEAFERFRDDISAWDRIAQPLQIASEIKGADEPNSQELYQSVRSVALELANEAERHDDAARVTRVSQQIFAELPSAKNQLRKDTEALDDIIERSRTTKALQPLFEAVDEAKADLAGAAKTILRNGFVSSAPGSIGAIRRHFDATLTKDVPQDVRDMAASLVRSLAVELFNKRGEILAPKEITSFLQSNRDWFSVEIQSKIEDDDRELTKNDAVQRLERALKAEDWPEARTACAQLLDLTTGADFAEFQKLSGVIEQRLQSRRNARIFWGGLAAVVAGFMIFGDSGSNDYSSSDTYATVGDNVEMPASEAVSLPTTEAPPLYEDLSEAAPAPYVGGTLGLPQLRYCIRQGERLDLARDMADTSGQQSAFNSAVSDYNSRCSSFRYDPGDMSKVRSEIEQIRGTLRSEAISIIGAPATPAAPSYSYPDPAEPDDPAIDQSTDEASSTEGDVSGY
jgi:hypothetical protein